MENIVNKNIYRVKPYVPGKPIEEVKRELGLRSVVKLASNENPFGPSPKVLKAISAASKALNRYPDGLCFYLRRELAKRLKVKEDQLIFGNGSDEVIVMAIRALVETGDEVVIAKPSFLIYEIAAKLAGANISAVALKDFYYDLEGMRKAVTPKTKIIFIGNPDNPAGTYVNEAQLVSFLESLPENILVFIDEAYYEYVSAKDYPDTVKLLKRFKNVLVTRTFSKLYGLAGLRIGYGIASPEVINILSRVREPFNVNSLAQEAALACLQSREYYQRIARLTEQQKKFLYGRLKAMKLSYKESATNFILVDVQKNGSEVVQKLMRKGVIVRDMSFWGLENYIRVTIGTQQENKKFLAALKEVLE